MKKPVLLFVVQGLFSLFSMAQGSDYTSSWFRTFGGSSIDKITTIEQDSKGNIYALGSFMKEVEFGDEDASYKLVSEQHFSVFLEKFSPEGKLLWVHKVEQIIWGQGAGMAIDSDDNVIISGSFFGTPFSLDTPSKSNQQKTSCFVEKVNPLGQSIWSFGMYTDGSAFGKAVATDHHNNIYIGGGFTGITDFEPSEKTHSIASNGGNDAFVLKLDKDGNFSWVYTFGDLGEEATYSLALDNAQRVYAAGSCGMNTSISEHFGGVDGFIHQLDPNGERKWAKTVGGNEFDLVNDIVFDSEYNLIVCGLFQKEMELIGWDGKPIRLSDEEHRNKWVMCSDAFILKYNQSGQMLWARQFGGVNNDQFLDVEIDENDQIIVGGSFERFAALEEEQLINPRPGVKSNGKRDGIVAMYNPHGNLKWTYSLGSREQDVINSLSLTPNNQICLGGYFGGKMNFSPENGLLNRDGMRTSNYIDCFIHCITPPLYTQLEVHNAPLPKEELPIVSTQENMVQIGTTIYPNPTANSIFLEFPISAETIEINVLDLQGNIVMTMESVGETNLQLDVRELASGTYIFQITLDNIAFSERIVIAR